MRKESYLRAWERNRVYRKRLIVVDFTFLGCWMKTDSSASATSTVILLALIEAGIVSLTNEIAVSLREDIFANIIINRTLFIKQSIKNTRENYCSKTI